MEEADPWVDGPGRPQNFYYRQQLLRDRVWIVKLVSKCVLVEYVMGVLWKDSE